MTSPKLASAERRAMLLHAVARVGKSVTSILDPDELLHRTVDIICDEFGFYYAGVFLIDDAGQWAVLHAGRGAAGAAMIAEGHKLAVGGNSMIGAATGLRGAHCARRRRRGGLLQKSTFAQDPFGNGLAVGRRR